MPRCDNEDRRFRAIWMKEFLGYSIDLVPATLHMYEYVKASCAHGGDDHDSA